MKLKYKPLFWTMALLAGFFFDQLFWEKPGGINFFIFICIAILSGLIPIWLEKIPVPLTSYILLIPILVFSFMTAIRAEPFTVLTNGLITISALILFSLTLLNGAWYQFKIWDYIINGAKFLLNSLIGGVLFFVQTNRGQQQPGDESSGDPLSVSMETQAASQKEGNSTRGKDGFFKRIAPYLRGLLLALPVLAILTLLLTSADPVFNNRIRHLFSWFNFENLGETLFRLFYILVIAYLLLSAIFFGLVESKKWRKKETDTSRTAILGSIESTIILGAINLLFLAFVILQFTYLFGGQTNISVEGYTYAEYARRGFTELLVVAIISLLVFYILSILTRRESPATRWTFSALGLVLVSLVAIILASAYTRLNLYEMAYGFTRLRTLAHVFMIWTGLLLAGAAILEITRRIDRMALILIIFIFGFGLTINILNIDAFIADRNVSLATQRLIQNKSPNLDALYLNSLSVDSIPPLMNDFTDADTPDDLRDEIGGILACHLASLRSRHTQPWSSWHYARTTALVLLEEQSQTLKEYPVTDDEGWYVEVNGETRYCNTYYYQPIQE